MKALFMSAPAPCPSTRSGSAAAPASTVSDTSPAEVWTVSIGASSRKRASCEPASGGLTPLYSGGRLTPEGGPLIEKIVMTLLLLASLAAFALRARDLVGYLQLGQKDDRLPK